MTTLNNGNKTINIKFNDEETSVENGVYTVALPIVTCTDANDAKTIQEVTNQFMSDLIRKVLYNKGGN